MIYFEHHSEPLLPMAEFVGRMVRNGALAGIMILCALLIGVVGYRWLGHLQWLDSLVNASMILGGMGPVDPISTAAGKWFESIYALFSGIAFLTSAGVFLAPLYHRFLHRFHLEMEES